MELKGSFFRYILLGFLLSNSFSIMASEQESESRHKALKLNSLEIQVQDSAHVVAYFGKRSDPEYDRIRGYVDFYERYSQGQLFVYQFDAVDEIPFYEGPEGALVWVGKSWGQIENYVFVSKDELLDLNVSGLIKLIDERINQKQQEEEEQKNQQLRFY